MKRMRLARPGIGYRYYTLLNVFLFTIIGFFSYYFILFSTGWWQSFDSERTMFDFGIGVVISFNLLCGGILWFNSVINTHYPFAYQGVGRMFAFFILVAGLLFLYNYGIYALLLRILSDTAGLGMGRESWMQLALVSLIDLLVVCLVLLNRSLTELRALQTQLNPHFLFNSLNTLLSEIEYDPDNAKLFTTRLAEVYRYILLVQDKDMVPLTDELEFLRAYLYLHQVRIGHGLKFGMQIVPEGTAAVLKEKKLPPLVLQLLVENILKHNTVSSRRPLAVTMLIDTENNTVTVENEVRLKKNVKSLGCGLRNLAERYRLLAGKEILVEKNEHEFKVKIPLFEV